MAVIFDKDVQITMISHFDSGYQVYCFLISLRGTTGIEIEEIM
jgi:hypothetical protein